MSNAFRWLHLTDLHQGLSGQGWLWPNVRAAFFEDLRELVGRVGPIDAVFFTGDLTQAGKAEEFERLDETLGQLWAHFGVLGCAPQLIAVPGNHDLSRPAAAELVTSGLTGFWEGGLSRSFWSDPDSPGRQLVARSFENYTAWWRRCPWRPPATTPGALPGDVSLSLAVGRFKVGVVGLNSASLQLSGEDFERRLALHPSQLNAVCEGDGPRWAARHQLCFLLTHHPPAWLHPTAVTHLRQEIAPAGRFGLHLFGHMHENSSRSESIGGGPIRREVQGVSMFGLEKWQGEVAIDRRHGYALGELAVGGTTSALRMWPREGRRKLDGVLGLGADLSFSLEHDQGTIREGVTLSRPISKEVQAVFRARPRPGGAYDKNFYVPRVRVEHDILDALATPGYGLVIRGPLAFGKTWLFRRVRQLVTERSPATVTVQLNFGAFDQQTCATAESLLFAMGTQIAVTLGKNRAWCAATWADQGATPTQRLTNLLQNELLPIASGDVVILMDEADKVVAAPFRDDFFGMQRAWCDMADEDPWRRLRVVLALTQAPRTLITDIKLSWFRKSSTIYLDDVDEAEACALAERYDVELTDPQATRLIQLLGGSPFLVSTALHGVASGSVGIDELCRNAELQAEMFNHHLTGIRSELQANPRLATCLREVVAGKPPRDLDAAERLFEVGAINQAAAAPWRLRGNLFKSLVS